MDEGDSGAQQYEAIDVVGSMARMTLSARAAVHLCLTSAVSIICSNVRQWLEMAVVHR